MGFYDVYLAVDPDGEVRSTVFPSDRPVYVIFKINDPTDRGEVTATWRAVEVAGLDANTVVWTEDLVILKSKGTMQAGGNGVWRPGKYKVELYLNGFLSSTQEFEVTN